MKRATRLVIAAFLASPACGGAASPAESAASSSPSRDADADASTTSAMSEPAAAAHAPEEVTFGKPTVALPFTSKAHLGIEMVGDVSAGDRAMTVDMSIAEDEVRHVALLATLPSPKFRVTYDSRTETKIQNGRQVTTSSPVAGNTYLVTLLPEGVTVDRDGKPAPRAEGEIVMELFRGYHERRAVAEAFAAKPLRVGESSEAVAAMVRADFISDPKYRVRFGKVSAMLKGTRAIDGVRCAIFDVHVQMALSPLPESKFLLDLRGELALHVSDALPQTSRLDGPAALRGTYQGVSIDSEGRAAIWMTRTYP